jgi:hypothetical protein
VLEGFRLAGEVATGPVAPTIDREVATWTAAGVAGAKGNQVFLDSFAEEAGSRACSRGQRNRAMCN